MKTTGLSRVSKESIIADIEKEIKKRPAFFITRHDSVPAEKIDKLRAKLRASQTRYLVVKNTLGQKAFERSKLKEMSEHVRGACGIAFTSGDPALSSKTLMEFSKENENFKVQAGFLNGQLVGAEQVRVLASLPSKEVLLGKVAGALQAPIRHLAVVLNASIRSLAVVLNAISKKKEEK